MGEGRKARLYIRQLRQLEDEDTVIKEVRDRGVRHQRCDVRRSQALVPTVDERQSQTRKPLTST